MTTAISMRHMPASANILINIHNSLNNNNKVEVIIDCGAI